MMDRNTDRDTDRNSNLNSDIDTNPNRNCDPRRRNGNSGSPITKFGNIFADNSRNWRRNPSSNPLCGTGALKLSPVRKPIIRSV